MNEGMKEGRNEGTKEGRKEGRKSRPARWYTPAVLLLWRVEGEEFQQYGDFISGKGKQRAEGEEGEEGNYVKKAPPGLGGRKLSHF